MCCSSRKEDKKDSKRLSSKYVNKFLVTITTRNHLYPYRTQKLSSYMPKILAGYPAGKIGSCQAFFMPKIHLKWCFFNKICIFFHFMLK